MKAEIKTETFIHPTAGSITRKYIYTYDESKYSSLEDAITDFNSYKQECDDVEKQFKIKLEKYNEEIISLDEKAQKKIEKPVMEKIAHRGYANKEFYVEPKPVDLSDIDINSLTDKQINQLKTRLGL